MKGIQSKYILGVLLLVVLFAFSAAQADIVGLWRFDEGSGSDAADSSGYGNDAAFWAITSVQGKVGGVATNNTSPRWIARNSGYAVELNTMPDGSYPDASNQNWNYIYTKTPRPASLHNISTRWTIAFWAKQYVNNPSINIGGGSGYQRVISCPKFEIELGVPTWMYDYFWPFGAVPGYGDPDSWNRKSVQRRRRVRGIILHWSMTAPILKGTSMVRLTMMVRLQITIRLFRQRGIRGNI
jgi:hypothetical protein